MGFIYGTNGSGGVQHSYGTPVVGGVASSDKSGAQSQATPEAHMSEEDTSDTKLYVGPEGRPVVSRKMVSPQGSMQELNLGGVDEDYPDQAGLTPTKVEQPEVEEKKGSQSGLTKEDAQLFWDKVLDLVNDGDTTTKITDDLLKIRDASARIGLAGDYLSKDDKKRLEKGDFLNVDSPEFAVLEKLINDHKSFKGPGKVWEIIDGNNDGKFTDKEFAKYAKKVHGLAFEGKPPKHQKTIMASPEKPKEKEPPVEGSSAPSASSEASSARQDKIDQINREAAEAAKVAMEEKQRQMEEKQRQMDEQQGEGAATRRKKLRDQINEAVAASGRF